MPTHIIGNNSPVMYFGKSDAFLESLYRSTLDRTPTADEIRNWNVAFEGSASYSSAVKTILTSDEFASKIALNSDFITALYNILLNRNPDTEGARYWSNPLQNVSKEAIINTFLESKEFQNIAAKNTNSNNGSVTLLASEGGGFRAMTSDAGLIAGAIKYLEDSRGTHLDISTLLKNVDALSGNSGSSWFLSCLAFSKDFEKSLENYKTLFDATDGGYMGLVGKAYINFLNPFHANTPDAINTTATSESTYENLLSNMANPNWENFLTNTVFAPNNTAAQFKELNFSSSINARTDAISEQPVIFEVAISATKAGIGPYIGTQGTAGEITATVANAGSTETHEPYIFIPSAVTSLGKDSTHTATTLPSIKDGKLELIYSQESSTLNATPSTVNTVTPHLNFDGLSVFAASSSSSAALAIEDSMAGSGNSAFKTYLLQELATPISIHLSDSASTGSDSPEIGITNINTLVKNPILRLGDGHYADGTSVTAGMSYFKPEQLVNGFTATLFGNMDYSDYKKSYSKIDASVLSILGLVKDPPDSTTGKSGNTTYTSHPSNKIFDLVNLSDPDHWKPEATWSYSSALGDFALNYYELKVKTSADNLYTSPNVAGTLKLWEVATPAQMAPLPFELAWDAYPNLYGNIIHALQTTYNGKIGASLLAESLGLG